MWVWDWRNILYKYNTHKLFLKVKYFPLFPSSISTYIVVLSNIHIKRNLNLAVRVGWGVGKMKLKP